MVYVKSRKQAPILQAFNCITYLFCVPALPRALLTLGNDKTGSLRYYYKCSHAGSNKKQKKRPFKCMRFTKSQDKPLIECCTSGMWVWSHN